MIPRPRRTLSCIVIWLAVLAGSLAAVLVRGSESRDYFTDVWMSENGLPDSSITSIAQTPDGYLWIGTYNGLARFDGKRFVTFDPANTPALLHAHIRKLYVDSQGTLWINTYDGSLTALRGDQFRLERRNTRPSEAELTLISSSVSNAVFLTSRGSLLQKSLSQRPEAGWEELSSPSRGLGVLCCADGEGTIWYRDGDKHFWRWRAGQFQPVPESSGFAGGDINCLATDSHGRLWLGAAAGIWMWDGDRFVNCTPTNAPPVPEITALAVTEDDHVWVVAGGCAGEAVDRRWRVTPDATRNLYGANPGHIGMQEDLRGGMWFYHYGRGLIHMNAAGELHPFTEADGFPGERVACFFEDHEGNWWAGLDTSGLVRVREVQFHTVAIGEGILARAAKSVCADSHGVVWIGTLSGGLIRWRDDLATHLPIPGATDMGSAFCLCPGADGRLWASADDEDLFMQDHGSFQRVSPVIHGVKAILVDRRGRTWVGTVSGLYVADPDSPQNFSLSGLARRSVRALSEDPQGRIWAGTGNGELYQIGADGKIVSFRPEDNHESGAIWSVLADADGTVWVGTFRGGLLRFRDGQFIRFGKVEGLPDNVICQILDDGRGNLWLGSHQGIFKVSKAALDDVAKGRAHFLSCVEYGRSDGLPSLECCGGYQPSACRDPAGRLWFATVKGAVWIQPDALRLNLNPPPVTIEEILLDGRIQASVPPVRSESTAAPASEHRGGGVALLTIPPGKHQIEIRYTGLSFVSPDRVQFRYRMDDVDGDWVLAGTRRFAQYSFMPPGHYRFQVVACNSDGIWNNGGAALDLNILPHFYETWWSRVLLAVMLVGGIAGSVRYMVTRRLRRKMEQLERQQAVERERTRIAQDIHDDLGASLTLIAWATWRKRKRPRNESKKCPVRLARR